MSACMHLHVCVDLDLSVDVDECARVYIYGAVSPCR